MYNDTSVRYKKEFSPLNPIDIKVYEPIIGSKRIEELQDIATKIKGKKWININSTFSGGGVAEMLKSVIPLAKGLGVKCEWECIEGTDEFFSVTKKYHNLMQGVKQPITMEEIFITYLETVEANFVNREVKGDLIVVHDPQPASSILSGKLFGTALWRCHIDTSEANKMIWNFFSPYINQYDGAIFTTKQFVKSGIKIPVYLITPAIDPLKEKNRQYTTEEAKTILEPLFNKYNIDGNRPIVLAVSRYDIHKNQKSIIDAFKKLKKDKSVKDKKPILIIVGNSASDDPEGAAMYEEIVTHIGKDKDIYPLLNIENNDQNIGALMKLAKVFVHISTKEGFGLVVTEAMWQGTPIIGSNRGGIPLQVIDKKTGFLVEPTDIAKTEEYMRFFILNEKERDELGNNAKEYVRDNFLITSLIKKYFLLMQYYTQVSDKIPDFRLNGVSYKEIRDTLYKRSKIPFKIKKP